MILDRPQYTISLSGDSLHFNQGIIDHPHILPGYFRIVERVARSPRSSLVLVSQARTPPQVER